MNDPDNPRIFYALNHSLRRSILRWMHGVEMISPTELSVALGERLQHTSYHVRKLEECEAIKLICTKPVRGAREHFYSFAITEKWALAALGLSAA